MRGYHCFRQWCCDTWTVTRVRHDLLFLLKDDQIGSARNTVGKSTGPTWSKFVKGAFLRRQNTAKRRPTWPSWSKLAFLGPTWSKLVPYTLSHRTPRTPDQNLGTNCVTVRWRHAGGPVDNGNGIRKLGADRLEASETNRKTLPQLTSRCRQSKRKANTERNSVSTPQCIAHIVDTELIADAIFCRTCFLGRHVCRTKLPPKNF